MTAQLLFYIIVGIIILNFIIDKIIGKLNAKHYNDPIPEELKDVYKEEEYKKSQAYKATNYKFGVFTSSFSIAVTLAFLMFGGFEFVDSLSRGISDNTILIALLFLESS